MRQGGPTGWKSVSRGEASTQVSGLPKQDISVAKRQNLQGGGTETRLQERGGTGGRVGGFPELLQSMRAFYRSQRASPMVKKVVDRTLYGGAYRPAGQA